MGAGFWAGGGERRAWSRTRSLNEQIQFACIGVGGKGKSDSADAARHGQVVAICDIDERTLDQVGAQEGFTDAKRFYDFREMLTELGDSIDAVTVSVPDHTHAVAAVMAMKMGKHCFCQKPLTHSIEEARVMGQLAAKKDLKTQMGNQGTALDGVRRAAAILKSGAMGNIHHIHIWTNRPVWPQGIERPPEEPVPDYIHWDEWLGPAPYRPFSGAYHPFKWRGFWDFGTGALGDMACHTMNMPFMGLDLRNPTAVLATRPEHNRETYPGSSRIVFEFPERNGRNATKMTWYDGGERPDDAAFSDDMIQWLLAAYPDKQVEDPKSLMTSGVLIQGENGTMFAPDDYAEKFMIRGMEVPDVEFEQSIGHFTEFADAIEGGPDATSNFPNYAGPLTETILLGNLSLWSGTRVQWDAQSMRPTNAPELERMVRKEYRDGYGLDLDVPVTSDA
jgi:predicted dehydrogenase